MKIVILEAYCINPGDISWDSLRSLGELTIYERTPHELIEERVFDADMVLINRSEFTAELMDKCRNLKYIGELATGYNNIDVAAATARGIIVTNIPAYSTPSVVQHTFALLLALCKYNTLTGKTMGIIGFGQIGKAAAKAATSFGMEVLACAAHRRSESGIENISMAAMDELLFRSDIVSLHCPLALNNREMICKDTINKMRNGALLINTARGGLVNENDVSEALFSGKLGGYAADVLTQEPPSDGTPLFGAPNCIITPHIAWAPIESRRRLINIATDNVRSFLCGHPQNKVNQ